MKAAIDQLEALIRGGKGRRAREEFRRLLGRPRLARADLGALAQLAWRLDLPHLGLKLLHPVVRPAARRPSAALPAERAEYAHCLIKLGALEEGDSLLNGLNPAEYPRIWLYRGSISVARWDYTSSISLFNHFIEASRKDSYLQMVGKVNLAAALVYDQKHRKVKPLLRELLYQSSLGGFQLMLGRVMELSAETLIQQKKWEEAEAFLREAARRLAESESIDAFIVDKYRAIVAFLRARSDQSARAGMLALREAAIRRKHWETVRDCDRLMAVVERDEALLARLYFGTPYPHLRQRILEDYAGEAERPREYLWELKKRSGAAPVFDLLRGSFDKGPIGLDVGGLLHRLIVCLASDLYRPQRLATVYAKLYPDRLFHPVSSPALVYDAIRRFRNWCKENEVPLSIRSEDGAYSLAAVRPVRIRLTSSEAMGKRYGLLLEEIRKAWPAQTFSLGEVVARLSLPRRTVFRALQDAVREGWLGRSGERKGTRYRVVSEKDPRKR